MKGTPAQRKINKMNEQEVNSAVKIGQLETQMNNIEKKVDVGFIELKAAISSLSEKVDVISDLKNAITILEKEVNELKKGRTFLAWVVPTIAAASGAVLTVLITNYVAHGGK